MDCIDIANDNEETLVQKEITRIRAQGQELIRTGECRNCGIKIEKGLFCSLECRDDYEHYLKVRGLNKK